MFYQVCAFAVLGRSLGIEVGTHVSTKILVKEGVVWVNACFTHVTCLVSIFFYSKIIIVHLQIPHLVWVIFWALNSNTCTHLGVPYRCQNSLATCLVLLGIGKGHFWKPGNNKRVEFFSWATMNRVFRGPPTSSLREFTGQKFFIAWYG